MKSAWLNLLWLCLFFSWFGRDEIHQLKNILCKTEKESERVPEERLRTRNGLPSIMASVLVAHLPRKDPRPSEQRWHDDVWFQHSVVHGGKPANRPPRQHGSRHHGRPLRARLARRPSVGERREIAGSRGEHDHTVHAGQIGIAKPEQLNVTAAGDHHAHPDARRPEVADQNGGQGTNAQLRGLSRILPCSSRRRISFDLEFVEIRKRSFLSFASSRSLHSFVVFGFPPPPHLGHFATCPHLLRLLLLNFVSPRIPFLAALFVSPRHHLRPPLLLRAPAGQIAQTEPPEGRRLADRRHTPRRRREPTNDHRQLPGGRERRRRRIPEDDWLSVAQHPRSHTTHARNAHHPRIHPRRTVVAVFKANGRDRCAKSIGDRRFYINKKTTIKWRISEKGIRTYFRTLGG